MKGGGGGGQIDPPGKTTLKKTSLIRVKWLNKIKQLKNLN